MSKNLRDGLTPMFDRFIKKDAAPELRSRVSKGAKGKAAKERAPGGYLLPHAVPGFRRELNVRDLGGYETEDGRKVREGLLIRCAAPGEMDAAEVEAFAGLGIVSLMDFRSGDERAKLPDPIGVSEDYYPISAVKFSDDAEVDLSPAAIMKAALGQKGRDKVGSLAKMFYTDVLFDNEAFRKMFDLLLAGRAPMAIHCTAGKDRTGIAAILILLVLGADRETAKRDYALTNRYRRKLLYAEYDRHRILNRISRNMRSVATLSQGVFPEMADAVFEAVVKKYGDFDTYFEKEYGLFEAEREKLREMYTEG
ncbi:MAG: tyrosine-protein phosphatase [Lachnospiraceae bacterium]|nr:tyrosine-protein phosphatase [Lachnospiraceae bacterium]